MLGALTISGCGSNQATSSATSEPTASPFEPATTYHHRHHHRHKHRYGSAAGAATSAGSAVAATQPAPAGSRSYPCNNPQFLRDQSQFASGSLQGDQEVDICGTVTNVLAEKDTRSGLHGYYDVQVAPGSVIEIVSDLGEMNAPAWPWVKVGDYSYVQGRYYYDSASSQGIDWTHHGTSRSWPTAGYVVVAGTKYQ